MRVAVHEPDGSVFAYKLGRIVDGQHNHNLLTGEITPIQDLLDGLVAQAKKEYPEAEVVIERLHDNGDETSEWRSTNEDITQVENTENHDVPLDSNQSVVSQEEGQ